MYLEKETESRKMATSSSGHDISSQSKKAVPNVLKDSADHETYIYKTHPTEIFWQIC